MPSMPAMPSIPNIPGLKKQGTDAEGAVDALESENAGAAKGAADDDEDRSRYIRYGPATNESEIFIETHLERHTNKH